MALTDRERLSLNLKTAREARGVSQSAAADAVGKSRGTIVNWENPGARPEPDSDEVAILAALYGVSTMDLRHADLVRQAAAPIQAAPQVVPRPQIGETGSAYLARVAKEKAASKGGRKKANGKG